MQPLRLLEYITSGSMGGAEHGILMEAAELQRRGHELMFACPRGRRLTRVLQERGYRVWAPRTFGKLDPVTLIRVLGVLRSRRVELAHTHLSTASLLGAMAARMAGIPSVATVHGLNTATCYRYSTLIVAVSGAVRDHLVGQGIDPNRIRVVHNGVDVDHFQKTIECVESRQRFGIPMDTPVLLYVGRLSVEKGVLLLPELMDRVRVALPSAQMLIVGQGALRDDLLSGFEKLGLTKSVRVMGYQKDTRPFMAAADLLVMPSYKEGLPRTLLEGMTAQLPCVATRAGGIPEVVDDGVTGQLVQIGEVSALAAACCQLLRDRERRSQMGVAARGRVKELFSLQRSVGLLENVFQEALEIVKRQ